MPPLPSASPRIISGSLTPTSHSDPTILDHESSQSQILSILVLFGRSWAKIWDNPAFPTQAKPQPGRPVTRSNFIPGCSNCYQSARSQILAIFGTFCPFLGDIGPFWALLHQNLGLGTPPHSQLGRSLSQDIY